MRHLSYLLIALAIAAVFGLGSVSWTLRTAQGFGRVDAGPWSAYPKTGTSEIDPYARAGFARRGELPLGVGEGIAFIATSDDQTRRLDASCTYRLSGTTPPARAWTLTAHTPEGGLAGLTDGRSGFTSGEILRESDGRFAIAVGRSVQPGNWLPIAGHGSFVLVLRLYDTPISAFGTVLDAQSMPRIERVGCA